MISVLDQVILLLYRSYYSYITYNLFKKSGNKLATISEKNPATTGEKSWQPPAKKNPATTGKKKTGNHQRKKTGTTGNSK